MATYYINNTTGTSTSPYSTWATGAHWTSTVARMCSAGDTVYYASSHAETITTTAVAAASWGWLGTSTSSVRIISADRLSGEPPSTMVFGASVSTTGTIAMTVVSTTAWVYLYGIAFNCATASTAADLTLHAGNGVVVYDTCRFRCGAQAATTDLIACTLSGTTILKNCSTIVTDSNTAFRLDASAGTLIIHGGQTLSTTPNPLLECAAVGTNFYIEGYDCSSLISSFSFINNSAATATGLKLLVRNTKVPNSWTGSLNAGVGILPGSIHELMNSDNADTNYRLEVRQLFGSIYHETTIVKTGGATDGTTPISWNVSSNAKAQWSHQFVESPEIVRWNTTVGSAVNCTIDFIHDFATTLTNRQVWLELQYLGVSGRPLGIIDHGHTTYNAPSSYHALSAASWTSTGMASGRKQLVSSSITPQEVGFIHAKVVLAASSVPIYVDPVIQLS